jgi:TonB family protein
MNTFLNYLIEVNIGIIIFLVIYRLLLKNETNFSFRRSYLLLSLLISVLFPLITIPGATSIPSISQIVPTYWLPELVVGNSFAVTEADETTTSSGWALISYVYLGGVTLCLLRFFIELIQLLRLVRQSTNYKRIIEIESNMVAFSFFQYIFIGNATSLTEADKAKVIQHERAHQQLGHSLDLIFIEILRILFWFNPALTQCKKELCTVHEYQADEKAVEEKDIQTYCNLLARVALMSADFSLANHFNNSLTIKRITMIKTMKTKMQWWKPAVMLPVVAAFFFAVACQDQIMEEIKDASKTASVATVIPIEVQARLAELKQQNPTKNYEVLSFDEKDYAKMKKLESNNNSTGYFEVIKVYDENSTKTGNSQSFAILEKGEQTTQLSDITKTDDEIFLVVEESATPVDGMQKYYEKIGNLISYPAEARKKGISGRVFVEFVVQQDGTVADLKVIKGIGEGCDEEAMRAITEAGLWNPGKQRGQIVKQRMVLPVSFSLADVPSASGSAKISLSVEASEQMKVEYQIKNDGSSKVLIGTVKSNQGNPLGGVNLVIANSHDGTVSKADGSFRLALPKTGGEVWLSHVSYKSSSIKF